MGEVEVDFLRSSGSTTQELPLNASPAGRTATVPLPAATLPRPDALKPRRERIRWRECLSPGSLELEQRDLLIDRLYGVYKESAWGHTRDQFEAHVFGGGEVQLALYYGRLGELAGFVFDFVQCLTYERRVYAVFHAGGFFRPGYRGGLSAVLYGLTEALRFKIRHPGATLGYLTRASTPAAYRLLVTTMPRIYPSRTRTTPSHIEALVRAISLERNYIPVDEGPWVVHSDATPRDSSRLRRLEDDPEVRFCLQLNPRFAEGDALLVWVPLDARNLAGGLLRQLRLRIRR